MLCQATDISTSKLAIMKMRVVSYHSMRTSLSFNIFILNIANAEFYFKDYDSQARLASKAVGLPSHP